MPEPVYVYAMPVAVGVAVGGAVGGAVFAAVKWLLGREVSRIDKHGERIEALERTTATKADLDDKTVTILNAIKSGNQDVIERVGEVRAVAERAHQRLDAAQAEELARLRSMHGASL